MKKITIFLFAVFAFHHSINAQIISEDFSTAVDSTPPAGWSQQTITGDTTTDIWYFDNPYGKTITPPISGNAAIYDNEYNDCQVVCSFDAKNAVLYSNIFDAELLDTVWIRWDQTFLLDTGVTLTVEAYNGTTWELVYDTTESTSTLTNEPKVYDISSIVSGVDSAQIRFTIDIITSVSVIYWIIDNLKIDATTIPVDVGVIAIDAPASGCGLTATESVTIRIKNFGSVLLNSIPVSFNDGTGAVTETITDSLNAGDTITYTFITTTSNLSAPGNYFFDAWTDLVGDVDSTNDRITNYQVTNSVISINTFPYTEDFESVTIPALPTGWKSYSLDPLPTDTFKTGTDATANGAGFFPVTPHTQFVYANDDACNCNMTSVYLEMPGFDFTGISGSELRFEAFNDNQQYGEASYIEVSTDCGVTWNQIYTIPPIPSGTWQTLKVNLSAYDNLPDVLIRFHYDDQGVWGGGLAIDNVVVDLPPPDDIGVIAINMPSYGCGFSATENVDISVTNFGAVSLDTIPVAYSINGGTVVNDTIFVTLNPGDTTTFVFSTTADLSATDSIYIFDAWTSLAGDADNTNDTATYAVNSLPTLASFPYFEDFEAGAGGWFSEGELWLPAITSISNTWALGTPAKAIINSAASGVNAWVTGGLTGVYPNLERSSVISPCFDFTSLVNPVIELQIWYEIEFAWDGVVMQSSIDGGSSWQNVGAFSDPFNWFNIDSLQAFGAHGIKEGWTGDNTDNSNGSGGWLTARNDLTGLGGQSIVILRIAFGSDWVYGLDGFAFDDISIFEKPPNDMSIAAIVSPTTGCGLTATESVTVFVYNAGSAAQSGFPVSYNDGSETVTESFPGSIAPGDTIAYTFTATSDLSALDSFYYFDAWTSVAGDVLPGNDSITNYLVLNPALITLFPYLEDFEAEPVCATNCGSPCPLTGWWYNSPNDDIDWTVDEGGTPTSTTGPSVDNTLETPLGNYLYTESSGCYDAKAILISPCLDISTLINPTLSFAYHMFGANMGNLLIEVESGGVWTNIGWIEGQQQTSPVEAWKTETISLNSFTGVIRIRFTGITGSDWTSDIAIDDISIFQASPDEVGVIAIDAPVSGCGFTATESVTIRVYNFGSATQTSIPVSYRINAGAPVSQTFAVTLDPGDTTSLTFATTADLSAFGTYIFDSWTSLPLDGDSANDSTTYQVYNQLRVNVCIYDEDGGSGDTTCSNFTNSVCSDGYSSGDQTLKFSDPILLNTSLLDSIDFYLYYTSCGDTTTFTFFLNGIQIGIYINTSNECTCTPSQTYPFKLTISDSAALNGALSCGTNTLSVIHDGASMMVAGYTAIVYGNCDTITNDVGIVAIDAPASSCGLTASDSVTVRVYNTGTAAQSSIPLSYSVNGGAPVNQTFAVTLNPGDTIALTFTTTADLSGPDSSYSFDAWTSLAGDGCNDNDSSLNVVVSSPVVNLGWDTAQCGGTVTLDAGNPGGIYLWSTGDTNQTIVASATGTYWVDVTNALGCTAWDSINVIISIPDVSVTPSPGVVCGTGDSVQLTVWGAVSYAWSPSDSLSATVGSVVYAYPTFDTIYTVIGTDTLGCTDTTTVAVNVSAGNPVANFVALGDTAECGTITVIFDNTSTDATLYSWWLPGGTTADSTVQNPVVTYDSVGTFDVTLTAYGCGGIDSIITNTGYITVYPPPIANITPAGATTICEEDSVELVSDSAATYNWFQDGSSTGVTSINFYASVSADYRVEVTSAFGCVNTSPWETVTVNPLPVANITPTGTTTLCIGDSVEFVSDSAATYDWLQDGVSTGVNSINFYASVSADYWVAVTNTFGCADTSAWETVTVNPFPSAPVISASGPLCQGGSVILTSSIAEGYMWSNSATTQNIVVSAPGSFTVTVDSNGCVSATSATTVLTIEPPVATPVISASGATTFCQGDSVTLTSSSANGYLWSDNSTTQGITVTASGTFTVIVDSTNGCSSVPSAVVTVNSLPIFYLSDTTIYVGDSVMIFGVYRKTAGIYYDSSTSVNGCDSIIVITLTITLNPSLSYGTQIGCTYYDLQTNKAVRNGLVRNPDGTMAAVWIQNHSGLGYDPADRGIGYNYYDGTQWVYLDSLPATPCQQGECGMPHGCASEFIGWPNIVWSDSIDEIVIAHTPLKITRRSTQGSGAWSTTDTLPFSPYPWGGNTWPRAVADGKFIHIIASSSVGVSPNGVVTPAVYYRSSDGGITWDIKNFLVPGMDDTTVISKISSADSYAIDARNGTVAFTAGGFGEDWIMWKSTANGDTGTWSFTIIAPFDTAGKLLYLGVNSYSVWTYDDAHAVTIDNNGMVHASTGQIVIQVDSLGEPTGSFFPLSDDGLYYWNENMSDPFIVAGLVDLPNWLTGDTADGDPSSGIGNDFPTYYLGVTSMSQVSIDQNNNPYIVYSGMVEWTSNNGDTSGQTFRDLYVVYSPDGGCTWSKPINIAGEIAGTNDGSSGTGLVEDVYPMTNKMIWADNELHIVWQQDFEPGTALQDSDPVVLNKIMHYSFDVTALPFDPGAVCSCFVAVTALSSQICTGDSLLLPGGSYADTAGTYYDTLIAVNGCDSIIATTITINSLPATPVISPSGVTTFCQGDSVTLTSSSAAGYFWSDSSTTQSITVTASGTFTVIVDSSNGCSSVPSAATTLTLNPTPVINSFTSTSFGCTPFNNTLCVTTTGADSLFWDFGDFTYDTTFSDTCLNHLYINLTNSAIFYNPILLVENSFGCTDTAAVAITVYALPTTIITATDASCAGANDGAADLTASGGAPPYAYNWSNGDTTEDVMGLSVGTYTVIVTDTNGCSAAGSVTLSALSSLSIVTSASAASCLAICNGTATGIAINGTEPYTYLWDDPTAQTNSTATDLCAGAYTVIATDSAGCTDTTTVIVSSPLEMILSITPTNSTCGNSDGSALVTVSNGTPPYIYSWSSGDTLPDANSLTSGIYVVTVTDVNGCSSFALATISDGDGPGITVITTTDITCNDGSNGVIGVDVTGGTSPYVLQWSNGSTLNFIFNLVAGPYELTVTDSIGCIANESVTLTQPDAFSFMITTTDANCSNNDGSATVNVSGGTGTYTYAWSNGDTLATADSLTAGVYTVTVTDASGCTDSASVAVSNVGGAVITIDSIIDGGCGASLGSIYISVTGGSGNFTYLWSDSSTTSQDLVGVSSGTYSVSVTDTNSCIATISAHISGVPSVEASICLVTVDSATGKNLVVWEKTQTQGVKSYNIYKESSQIDNYYWIGNVSVDSVSVFVDTLSDPAIRSWRYKIQVVDSCDNESELSADHKTMHLNINLGIPPAINLIWDHYKGDFTFFTYYVLRYTALTGWDTLDALPKNLISYTDPNPPNEDLYYFVEVRHPAGCDPNMSKTLQYNSAKSNVTNRTMPTGISNPQDFQNLVYFNVYPNPYTRETKIAYTLQEQANVLLEVYNVLGKKVQVIVNGEQDSGKYRYSFSAKDQGYSSGVYILKLIVGDWVYTKQLVEY